MSTVITSIDPHSPAEKAGITVGEQLLEINGHKIVDVLDYRFYGYDPGMVTSAQSPSARRRGRIWD